MRRGPFPPRRPPPPRFSDVLHSLEEMTENEDDRYDEIEGWDGATIVAETAKAILIPISGRDDVWFPKSQLRVISAERTVYASKWILKENGFG